MTILLFFAVLFVLILVHEWGHFITAKWTGMRVDEFGIGFPPKLFGVKRGETEYTFNALPIGGFVRIFGEDGTNVPSSPVVSEANDRRSEALAEAGDGGQDAVGAAASPDYVRSFVARPKWAQAIVLVAGVTMNVLFAWLLFFIVFTLGVPTVVDESVASPEAALTVTSVLPESPAAEASVPAGAEVVSLSSGETVLTTLTPTAFSAFTTLHAGEDLTLRYQVGEEVQTVGLTTATDVIADEPERPAIGVSVSLVETVRTPFFSALKDATVATYTTTIAIALAIMDLLVDSVTLQADLSQVSGPVGIVGMVGDAASFGLTSLLLFTAAISLNLAIINLLPFPALDGGRLVLVLIETVTRRPINPKWVYWLNSVGFALLILLMVAVTWSDIGKLL